MVAKSREGHRAYIQCLRRLTPEQRLLKAIELTERANALAFEGLRLRHPAMLEGELRQLHRQRLLKCHNQNF